jgi:hypothetical protein
MALGSQMQDHIRLIAAHNGEHPLAIADIRPFEPEPLAGSDGLQRVKISGVSKLVHDEHVMEPLPDQLASDGGAYEAGPTSDKELLVHAPPFM